MFAQQDHELPEVGLGPALRGGLLLRMLFEVVLQRAAHLVEQRGDQPAENFGDERSVGHAGLLVDQREEAAQRAALLVVERQGRMGRELQIERHHPGGVDAEPLDEVARDGDHVRPEMLARMDLDDVLRDIEEQVVLLQPILLHVEREDGAPFGADADDEGVDPAGEPEGLQMAAVVRDHALVDSFFRICGCHRQQLREGETGDFVVFSVSFFDRSHRSFCVCVSLCIGPSGRKTGVRFVEKSLFITNVRINRRSVLVLS